MNITLRQLRYFVEIARSGSFSRAAQHLAIAQPALSQNIAALEDDLGAKLFERHAKGVDLSVEGQRLYARAQVLIAEFDALKHEVHASDTKPSGSVSVMLAGSVAGVLVAPLLQAVATSYPDIQLSISDGMSFEARRQVEAGHTQLALIPSPSDMQGMHSMPLFEEHFMLFGAPSLMQPAQSEIAFTQLAHLPLAAPDRAYDLRKMLERAAHAMDQPLDIRYELNSPPMLEAVVKHGLAYAVLPPSSCLAAVAAQSIVGRPIAPAELNRVQALVWPQQRPLTPATAAVKQVLVAIVGQQLAAGLLYGRPIAPAHKKI